MNLFRLISYREHIERCAMPHEKQLKQKDQQPVKRQWLSALVMSFIALPIIAALFLAAYGFIVWFGQMWFWGPPS